LEQKREKATTHRTRFSFHKISAERFSPSRFSFSPSTHKGKIPRSASEKPSFSAPKQQHTSLLFGENPHRSRRLDSLPIRKQPPCPALCAEGFGGFCNFAPLLLSSFTILKLYDFPFKIAEMPNFARFIRFFGIKMKSTAQKSYSSSFSTF
jgi:hypothetical protein